MKKQHLQALIAILVTLLLPIFFLKRSYMMESRTRHISTNVDTPHTSSLEARDKQFLILIPITEKYDTLDEQIESIYAQKYTKYRIVYLIDSSTVDRTEVVNLIENHGHRKNCKIELIRPNDNMISKYEQIVRSSMDNEVIVHLESTDIFAANNVLELLNHIYCTEDIWLTYSQYLDSTTYKKGMNKQTTSKSWSIKKSQQRNWIQAPLKTYYASVFKQLSTDEIAQLKEGGFEQTLEYIMRPMAEFSQKHIRYVPDVLSIHS